MSDPIEKLAEIFPNLQNGQKLAIKDVKASILEMQATIADLESAMARQPLPEAPASISVKVVDPANQFEYLVTVREARAGFALISHIPDISAALVGLGLVAMDAYIDGRRAERAESGKALPLPAAINPMQSQALTFEAKSLAATVNDGKAYWKVKGGRFEKFGITVWPETLEKAGFFVNELNVMESYNLTGWTATYTTKEGDKPDKVIGLAKAA